MAAYITIDNLKIDEAIPGLKIGTLSSGGAVGTFSISDLSSEMRSSMGVYSPESKTASGFVHKQFINRTIRSSFQFKQQATSDLDACY
jgi:hypothetical protein